MRDQGAVVAVSGGMDSAVTASVAAAESDRLFFLHANYGQRTEGRELACFHLLADHFKVRERLVADLGYLSRIGGSSLTDVRLSVEPADLSRKGLPSTYVPFRNAHLLCVAVSWAEAVGADAIYVGAVWEDSSGYPDCRPEFYQAFQRAVDLGTGKNGAIRLVTPVIDLTKAGIVRLGLRLGTPFDLTWSCYRDGEKACGDCDSCALRLRGFAEAGETDPIRYRERGRRLMAEG